MAKRRRLTKKQRERRNRWVLGLVVALLIFVTGYLAGRRDVDFQQIQTKLDETLTRIEQQISNFEIPQRTLKSADSALKEATSQVHILDVGQGAATLLIAEDGSNILIDTGRFDDSEKKIISYLDHYIGLGNEIDLLIFSHNDSDHIGHGELVLEYFEVQEVWMNGLDHTTKVYSNLLDAILNSDADYLEPKAGEHFTRAAFEIEVLHPKTGSTRKNHNDESLVTRIEFDGLSLMTSGDASMPRENEIIKRSGNLQSDILMLGHHGASDSTGENWLRAVKPQIAFYQAGQNNSYGHPGIDTLERLDQLNIPVYGTDELGTISLYIDEAGAVEVQTEVDPNGEMKTESQIE